MPITADHIRATLTRYTTAHPEDAPALAPLHALLDGGADVTARSEVRGHVTAGAVLVNEWREALLIHHVALDRWLTPGGHLESDDTDLMNAALRELFEETGIGVGVAPVGSVPIHVDIHDIPANAAKNEPAHWHADFRYVFRTLDDRHAVSLQQEEVTDYAWRNVETIADRKLRSRVLAALI